MQSRSVVFVGCFEIKVPATQISKPLHTRSLLGVFALDSNCSAEHTVEVAHSRLTWSVGGFVSCSLAVHAVCVEQVVNECFVSLRYVPLGQALHALPSLT